MRTIAGTAAGCALIAIVTACAGCGSGGASQQNIAVTATPGTATVPLAGTQQFTASETKNGQTIPAQVNWSVNGVAGGNTSVGTVSSAGLYTAPTSIPSQTMETITATAQADPTKTATGSVTIVYPNDNGATQTGAIKLGTSGGNATDSAPSGNNIECCSGTLGSLISRGGLQFILSNNHVLDKSNHGTIGDPISQPGLIDNNCNPGTTVANLSQVVNLQTSNPPVDAAMAQVVPGAVDTSGSILNLGAAGPTSIAAAPPSATLASSSTVLSTNEQVAKSGRSSGLTCSTLSSISTSVVVDYSATCGGATSFTITFQNQVIVNGGNFSAAGDSGSLVVTADTARPVALLFAGNSAGTAANPIQTVLNALKSSTNVVPTIVGGGDHAVSCAPTASLNNATASPTAGMATLAAGEIDRATTIKEQYAAELMRDAAVSGVGVGISADNPGESALVIYLTGRPSAEIPPQIEGVRTRIVFGTRFSAESQAVASEAPLQAADIERAIAIKDAHTQPMLAQAGIVGIGVGRSADDPAKAALVVYVEKGKLETAIPVAIDGLRTKIIEGDRFRALRWGKPETRGVACYKPDRGPKD
ncbi:MAG: hypothetical protein ACRD4S_02310 [Candidatus Acidiferrales bacterium]